MNPARTGTRPIFHTTPGGARDLIASWIATPALRELVEAEGGTWPTGELGDVIAELEAFSEVWDYRGGKSRLSFHDSDESRTDERAQLVYRAARDLGLLDSPPPTMTEPDYLVILGGLATGVEPRARYAAQLLDTGTVTTDRIVSLGSFRPLHERERQAAATYAPDARYEIELLGAMTALVLGATGQPTVELTGDPDTDPARAEEIRRWPGHPAITTYAARSSQPGHRPANTADTYHQFAAAAHLHPGDQLLLITSTIYRPYQHLEALRALTFYDLGVETVGVPAAPDAGPKHPPSAYLQEVRSVIRSALAAAGPTISC